MAKKSGNAWISTFLGTPKRALATVIGVVVAGSMLDPTLPSRLYQRTADSLTPLAGPVISLAILWMAYKLIFSRK